MTAVQSSVDELLPMDTTYALFPESNPKAVFANDIALLMGLALPLSDATAISIVVDQLEKTVNDAVLAGLVSVTDPTTMLCITQAYLILTQLKKIGLEGNLPEGEWERAVAPFKRLSDITGVMVNEKF